MSLYSRDETNRMGEFERPTITIWDVWNTKCPEAGRFGFVS